MSEGESRESKRRGNRVRGTRRNIVVVNSLTLDFMIYIEKSLNESHVRQQNLKKTKLMVLNRIFKI